MAKSVRKRKPSKAKRTKTSRKRPSSAASRKRDPLDVAPITAAIKSALERLQPLKDTSHKARHADVVLRRCLGELEDLPTTGRVYGGKATGGLGSRRNRSFESGGHETDAGAGAPDMSTHGSGGGGFD